MQIESHVLGPSLNKLDKRIWILMQQKIGPHGHLTIVLNRCLPTLFN